jgi:hypothetical protein
VSELQRKRKPETDAGAVAAMWAICKDKAIGTDDQGLLAMQKHLGSFGRESAAPAPTAYD